MTPGLYVYGIVGTGSLAAPLHADGIAGAPAALLEVGPLTAVITGVDVAEFEGEALERNAATPEWLEQQVRAHESVLEHVLASATVVPMRFGSIFSSPAALTEMLTAHAPALTAALDRVRGCTEWGVKVHCDHSRLIEAHAGAAPESSSGRGYLLQRKAQLEAGTRAAETAAAVAADVHASLAGIADEANLLASRSGEALNGAYLVRHRDREAFMRRVDDLGARHGDAYVFEVTGPWPPYNFCSAGVGGPSS